MMNALSQIQKSYKLIVDKNPKQLTETHLRLGIILSASRSFPEASRNYETAKELLQSTILGGEVDPNARTSHETTFGQLDEHISMKELSLVLCHNTAINHFHNKDLVGAQSGLTELARLAVDIPTTAFTKELSTESDELARVVHRSAAAAWTNSADE
eukprot:TRINITY_DN12912_c0_g1_i2.p1 TRINITY_DN12912_c0_g1~~TRINITY_DN12912_c0_g1_i2.p1  ORF type:complete len:157 (+),score=33.34 TRINITY_DN12912_c0_g1_i2:50-520(+)